MDSASCLTNIVTDGLIIQLQYILESLTKSKHWEKAFCVTYDSQIILGLSQNMVLIGFDKFVIQQL